MLDNLNDLKILKFFTKDVILKHYNTLYEKAI